MSHFQRICSSSSLRSTKIRPLPKTRTFSTRPSWTSKVKFSTAKEASRAISSRALSKRRRDRRPRVVVLMLMMTLRRRRNNRLPRSSLRSASSLSKSQQVNKMNRTIITTRMSPSAGSPSRQLSELSLSSYHSAYQAQVNRQYSKLSRRRLRPRMRLNGALPRSQVTQSEPRKWPRS